MRENFGFDQPSQTRQRQFVESGAANAFLRQVFTTMSLGLLITGMTAWWVANTPEVMRFFFNGVMMYITIFSPLVLVLVLQARIHRMSFSSASIAFASYAVLLGISLSSIFLVYSMGSIAKVFFITAGMFGAMAVIGLTTSVDLSKFKSILIMGMIGIVIASIVNFFLQSDTLSFIYSLIGVVVFSGLAAYETQNLLTIGAQVDPEEESSKKLALQGALFLYITFINLFLSLLRLFGGRD